MKFSKSWKKSSQRRKQRKYIINAPFHLRTSFASSPLSKELKKTHKKNAVPVRTGDTVKVMRGSSKGKTGKVMSVDRKSSRVIIDGVTRTKGDGSTVPLKIHSSKVVIISLMSDKKRFKKQATGAKNG